MKITANPPYQVGTKHMSKNIWKQMEGRIGRLTGPTKRQKRWKRMNKKEKFWDLFKNGPLEKGPEFYKFISPYGNGKVGLQ